MFILVDYKYGNLFTQSHIDKQIKIIAADFVGYKNPNSLYIASAEYEGKIYLRADINVYYKCGKAGNVYSWAAVKGEYELLSFNNSDMELGYFELTESLCSNTELTFGCCEASSLKLRVHNNFVPLTGKWLIVAETLEGHTDEPFNLGRYKVYSDIPTADRAYRDVTAYDAMYDIINSSVINWYNTILPNVDSKVTMKQFRTSFIESFGLAQDDITLANDNIIVEKTIEVGEGVEIDNDEKQVSIIKESALSGLDVISAICEINGCFGHIGRNGNFQYIYLEQDFMGLYPSDTLFPDHAPYYLRQSETGHLYPQDPKSTRIGDGTYISASYEDFLCQKINKVQIRQEENDIGAQYPEGKVENENSYIIEGNFLVYGKSADELSAIAERIFDKIAYILYRPFSCEAVGNPCLEVGDPVRLSTKYELIESYVLKRTLKGIQAPRDTYSAEGTEYFSENVNSISQSIIQLKGKANILVRNVEETRSEIIDVEAGLKSEIVQTATEIKATVSEAASKYDTTGYNVTLFGYESPPDIPYSADERNGEYYLNQSDGRLYESNGETWVFVKTLPLISENLSSQISLNSKSIELEVARASEAEGKLSGEIQVTADKITAEVKRATDAEGELSGKISVEADKITAEVKRATDAEGSLSAKITVNAEAITQRVTKGSVSSEISQEAGKVSIKANRLVVESSQFTLDENGNATFGGNLKAATGTFYGTITSDNGSYFAKITNASLQGGWSGRGANGYVSFNTTYTNTRVDGTRIAGKGLIALYTPYLGVGKYTEISEDGTVFVGQSGSTEVVTGITDNGDGTISWRTKTITFEKGLMATVL